MGSRNSKLLQVNLTLARTQKTEISESVIWKTVFSRINLSEVKGLDTCIYPGPSIIDGRTLANSTNIPLPFLQGCGLSDWQIEATKLYDQKLNKSQVTDICYEIIRLKTDPTLQFYSCFISYSHKDRLFAKKLHDALQKHGVRCWLDDRQILPGDDIFEEIDRGIRLGNKVLSLIPLNLDNYLFSEECSRGYTQQITSRLAADFTEWRDNSEKFNSELSKVMQALRSDNMARKEIPASLR